MSLMPPIGRRRPLLRAAMVGGGGYAVGKRVANRQAEAAPAREAPGTPPAGGAASEADRVEALTKLKGLLDSGVLTEEQYEAEKQKLLRGM
jgi:hypothetical protein